MDIVELGRGMVLPLYIAKMISSDIIVQPICPIVSSLKKLEEKSENL